MSILIKKMEMPKGCWACPFAVGKHYECLFTKKSTNWGLTTRPSDCPLIEVKSPHGRLIDADELITKVQKLYCKDCILRTGKKNGKMQYIYEIGEAPCRGCWIDDMVSEIGDAPTIIEAEGSDT